MSLRAMTAAAIAIAAPISPAYVPTEGRIPGNRGIWVGIYCEMTEFALMFLVFFLARAHNPEAFHEGPARLATSAGTANTLLMLTSSYFVARAVGSIRRDQARESIRWLGGALLCAFGYLVVKYFEFTWYAEQGINGAAGVFFTAYYYLGFNHLVHVGWGSLGILWVMARTWMGAYSPENHEGMEAFASYWHTIDLAWLIIFPLAYVWH